ncbi:MAG: sulfotransferase [Pseudomonadales bacterium]|nr:sulfotransferase [Pseudomonadales bacterium]
MPSKDEQQKSFFPPVVIGGVGGSGTRAIATILQKLGFYIGSDLNEANDNLAFTLLFKRKELWPLEKNKDEVQCCLKLFLKAMLQQGPWQTEEVMRLRSFASKNRPQHPSDWLKERAEKLIKHAPNGTATKFWGWKEPNSHIVMPALLQLLPDMKYIHVMRHGLDMAYSSNQNQLQFWGEQLLGETNLELTPANSFRYWCAAHRRVQRFGEKMGHNFLLLNFDLFCKNPVRGLDQLLEFIRFNLSQSDQSELISLISPPLSIGRYKKHKQLEISQEDFNFLHMLGYSY